MPSAQLDVVLFGASGFTGALTAAYLAEHAPADLRWGIAGRNRGKLERLRADLHDRFGSGDQLEILEADVTDRGSVRRVAERASVVASTVGPYLEYGEPLVAACAEVGSDYLDLTGEPEFVDRMYLEHGKRAEASGARLVHACGFDSIPHDLGAQFTVEQLPDDVALRVKGYVTAGGTFSGGTFASALTAFSRPRQMAAAASERRKVEPKPIGRRVRAVTGAPGYDRAIGQWVLPFPSLDPQVVARSARALPEYGPDFSYSHFVALANPLTAVGIALGAAGVFTLAQLPPTRALLQKLRPSGSGPSPEQREKGWFRVRFVAESSDGQSVRTEVSGGDPGYSETAKMLAESALCLASDELPTTAGQVTTATAMGAALRRRLERADMRFRVLDDRTSP
ncbi:MAG TPA: saccharopine dehydrogenase NADP-binding domain-containing protein [Frankiaceae bacterium]|nr:saccharopine dehydrogenase NADP-binding domain-containing protein [Frankiaceae bacterium]